VTKTPHTTFTRGTHVFVILRDGSSFDDNYVDRNARYVILREKGEVKISDIRSMSFYKNKTGDISGST